MQVSCSLAEGLSRKVGFSFPSLAHVAHSTVKYPLPCGIPAKLGHLDFPQHQYNIKNSWNVTEIFEVAGKVPGTGGSQSVLLGQEKDISYQTFFLFGVIFSKRMKQAKVKPTKPQFL